MSQSSPNHTQTSIPKSSILDYLDEGRLTDWLSLHGKNIIYTLAGLVALLVIIYTFSSSQNSKAEHEYIQAANDFAFFSRANEAQDPALVKESLESLKSLMAKHPELHAAYDGSLAQIFLIRSQPNEAKAYAEATLARVKSNDLTFYNDYAEASLLISQQNFKKALESTVALHKKLTEAIENQDSATPRSFSDELFALNLLRMGMLQQEIGDKAAELQTWQEWKQYAGLGTEKTPTLKVNPQVFRLVIQQLAIGTLSLPDYIAYRENELKK